MAAAVQSEDPVFRRLAELRELVDTTLAEALPAVDDARSSAFGSERLIESMTYSLTAPGKRLRPLLLLASAEACGGRPADLVHFSVGLEMIHAYSLIHDDLPAMDDDELRRGRPTNHVVFGDAMAILAGDALLTEAFRRMSDPIVDAALQLRVIGEVAHAAGYRGMVGGQAADLLAEKREPEEALLRSIHTRKTGALLAVAVRAGALLAGAFDDDRIALECFAEHFGLAFQIADDVKDETVSSELSGKRGGGDLAAAKMTYPALFGIEESRRRLEAELERASEALSQLGPRAALLEGIVSVSFAVVRGATPPA